jgi:hypothetical protein
MDVTFKNQPITHQDILDALHEFAAQYPDPGEYDRWLEKGRTNTPCAMLAGSTRPSTS